MYVGTPLFISGWGAVYSGYPHSGPLKIGLVSGMSNGVRSTFEIYFCHHYIDWGFQDCSATGYHGSITPNMICATSSLLTSTDACQGDSGGNCHIKNPNALS